MTKDVMLLALYCGLIFFLSHQPSLPMPLGFPHQDKLVHGLAYAIMGLLAWRTFKNRPVSRLTVFVLAVLFCGFYGASDEFHQSFIVGRDSDIWDWFADTTGAILAVSLLTWRAHKT